MQTHRYLCSPREDRGGPPGTAPPGPGPAQEMGIVPNGIDIHTRRISGLLTSSSYFPFAPFRPSLVPTFELPFSGGGGLSARLHIYRERDWPALLTNTRPTK